MSPARAALFALALIYAPGAVAQTEVARVRSGEHAGFTRLAIGLGRPSEWRLGRVEGGYGLEILRGGVSFDLGEVYRLIGRERVAALRYNGDSGWLEIAVTCTCHARAVNFGSSWIVVDIVDGVAAPSSPFELALAGGAAPIQGASNSTEAPGARRVLAPGQSVNEELEDVEAALLSETAPAAGSTDMATPTGENRGVPSTIFGPGGAFAPEYAAWEAEWLAGLAPGLRAEAAVPMGETTEEPATRGRENISDQEKRLLEELARAAAQGLLEANIAALDPVDETHGGPVAVEPPAAEPTPAEPSAEDHVRMSAETSIDRDSGIRNPNAEMTPDGKACLPDRLLAVETWGVEADLAQELTERRRHLVGEFDRPDPEAVLALTRYYVFLGFGAEAKSVIGAFGMDAADAAIPRLLANIVDGERQGLPGLLSAQGACPGRAALWSVLAEEGPRPGERPNTAAILAAVSALPLHLRRHLVPALAERFLAVGDQATVIALRNTVTRAPGPYGDGLQLLDARISLSEGMASAPSELEALVGGHDTVAAVAYAQFLRTELAAGRAPPKGAETAAALAFEIAGTKLGGELAELAVRTIIASGDFDAARREALRLEEAGAAFNPSLWQSYAIALTLAAQDGEFLRQAFAARGKFAEAKLPIDTAVGLARRLNGLGFPGEALRYLPDGVTGEAARFARAEALLAAGSPGAAIGALTGIESAAAERVRASALLALGDMRGASERFGVAGDPVSAERAAWVAGAWDLLRDSEDPAIRRLAEERDGAGPMSETVGDGGAGDMPMLEAPGEPVGRVDRARVALSQAQAARELLAALLARGNR